MAGTAREGGGIVLWHTSMSLDGFIAGPDDAMDWVFEYAAGEGEVDDVMAATGAMLGGRRGYDVARRDAGKPSGEAFGGAWSGAELVLTHRPPEDDPDTVFLSGDVREAVRRALAAAGGKDVIVAGADVARQCIAADLVDEVQVHVLPVLLGAGTRLFGGPGSVRTELEPLWVRRSGETAVMRYRIRKGTAPADG
ncbi:dihydrofolate reductase family protein [Nocardiopsis potens]|uniref:dihydrofolate reductase family protein n=1 Tax=Nocardiopsis potens TaxID=1246458 RepID=UPI00034CEEA6|nr:dihydrofolate reductase family protein [Nocardiopsis potens]